MTSSKQMNLVLGYTPYHQLFASEVAQNLEGKTFCFFSAKYQISKLKTSELGLPYRGKNFFGTICFAFSVVFFSVFFWTSVFRKTKIKVYLPHANHFIGNYLYFSKYVNEVYIYEDGILNYYDVDIEKNEISLGKKILSYLVCMPYLKYKGHMIGLDAREANGAFLSRPECAVRKKKIYSLNKIAIVDKCLNVEKGVLLFLDQNVTKNLSDLKIKKINNAVAKFVVEGQFVAYYKAHHEYSNFKEWKNVMKELACAFDKAPAEELIQRLRPEVVCSYYSSALINIKQRYPNVICISLASDSIEISRDGRQTNLSELFIENGVFVMSQENGIDDLMRL